MAKAVRMVAALLGSLGLAFAAIATSVAAQDYPSRPMRLIVGFPPGGGTDVFARLLAPHLAEQLGQPIAVENRSGVNGGLATEHVARSAPDEHTLMISTSSVMGTGPHAFPNSPVHPVRDLGHVTMLAESSYFLVTNPGLQAKSFADFIAAAKAAPGRYVFASQGIGSAGHITAELLQLQYGISIKIAQYRGGGAVVTDLLADQVHLSIFSAQMSESYFNSGRLGALAIMAKARSPGSPNVPASTELGAKSLDQITYWAGLHVPKGTPEAVITRLHKAVTESFKNPAFQERMAAAGLTPIASAPADFVTRMESDLEMYGAIFKAANIKVE
jgi:tripartite-type tricarboxylate transporter receptor subunit TctC